MQKNAGGLPPKKFDFIIAGAGASGLLLAIEMLQNNLLQNQTLCIVEQDAQKLNDRTWCFWSNQPLPDFLQSLVSQSWTSCIASGQHQKLAPFTYHHLRSADFYAACLALLKLHPSVTLLHAEVLNIKNAPESARVTTPLGDLVATYVFSSIPKFHFPALPEVPLWQSFFGWRIRFLRPPSQPLPLQLMDFNIPQNGATQFIYTLPFDDHRALVELTRFSPENLNPETAKSLLTDYLSKWEVPYEIEEVEINRIPMTNAFNAPQPHHTNTKGLIAIGAAAGALKPTSGYAFLTMHQHAQQMVAALLQKQPLPTIYRKKRFRFYDALLLQILIQEPQHGKSVFTQLFSRVPTPRILNFLDEKTSLIEEIQIFIQLPILLFLKQVLRYFKLIS
jgi:lycopene beta-cyclase